MRLTLLERSVDRNQGNICRRTMRAASATAKGAGQGEPLTTIACNVLQNGRIWIVRRHKRQSRSGFLSELIGSRTETTERGFRGIRSGRTERIHSSAESANVDTEIKIGIPAAVSRSQIKKPALYSNKFAAAFSRSLIIAAQFIAIKNAFNCWEMLSQRVRRERKKRIGERKPFSIYCIASAR